VRRRRRPPLPAGFRVVWATVAIDLVGFGMGVPVLARYAEGLGATPAQAGLAVAAFSAAQCACAPVLGRLSDRYGRKPVLVGSLAGTAVGSLLTGLAGSLWMLVAARLVDGASGASVSVAQATVVDVAPERDRARLLGYLGAAFGVGLTAGPALGALAALASPRLPFLLAAALAAANAVAAVRRLPETRPRPSSPPAPAEPAEPGAPHPAADGGRAARRLAAVVLTSTVAFAAFEATWSLLLHDRYGLSPAATYAAFAAVGVALVAVQGGLVGPAVARLGPARAVRTALAALAGGMVLLVPAGWAFQVPALALLVAGQGVLVPAVAATVAGLARPSRSATALARQQSASALARAVGPTVGGVTYGLHPRLTPAVAAGLVAAALALAPRTLAPRARRPGR
jgi:DHA1 family tetracycline resistance protein-like MFS transporter